MNLSVAVSEDAKLNVRHWQGAQSPPFLLVHGLDSNARTWELVANRLAAAGHPAYAVDMRGHGESDAPGTGYDNATAAADLVAVCRALGVKGAVVAGHSWGAHIALRLAAEHPDLVAGLVLVEGGWVEPAAVHGAWESFAAVVESTLSVSGQPLGGTTLGGMRDYLRTLHPDWSAEAVEASLFSLRVEPDGSLSPRLSTAQRTAIMHSLWEDAPARWFPALLRMPIMLMAAFPRDNVRWPPSIRALVERNRSAVCTAARDLPHARVREYFDSDHDLHAQRPEAVADDLLRLARELH
ncbi:alpha/beta fold hydrolase [Streptomyces sp. NPDC087844]|uniref:alpha/beta fold hydrolase n=1 Tax=Streptomyces sp. NPDC087844 TaxID=3365805 RepID=UPI00381DF8CC